jgi:hypothetical protein
MRRKIEKYLAQKMGLDESQVQPTEDGRYDFKDDFDGVLAAVRGKDCVLAPVRVSKPNSARSSRPSGKKPFENRSTMPYYHYSSHYSANSYASNIYGPPHSHLSQHSSGKENLYSAYPSWSSSSASVHRSRRKQSQSPSHVLKTPRSIDKSLDNFSDNCLTSARKSIFDSPARRVFISDLHMNLGGGSPNQLHMQGLTPPMSDLKNTFATPLPSDSISNFSPDDADCLNKTLFSEAVMTPFPKTPSAISVSGSAHSEPLHFCFGREKPNEYKDMRLSNRVSISPIFRDTERANFYDDDDQLDKSMQQLNAVEKRAMLKEDTQVDDTVTMPPPTAPRVPRISSKIDKDSLYSAYKGREIPSMDTPCHLEHFNMMESERNSKLGSDPTPFDSCKIVKQLTSTPSTVAMTEQSFWSDQYLSPVPLSPFNSPSHSHSMKSSIRSLHTGNRHVFSSQKQQSLTMEFAAVAASPSIKTELLQSICEQSAKPRDFHNENDSPPCAKKMRNESSSI